MYVVRLKRKEKETSLIIHPIHPRFFASPSASHTRRHVTAVLSQRRRRRAHRRQKRRPATSRRLRRCRQGGCSNGSDAFRDGVGRERRVHLRERVAYTRRLSFERLELADAPLVRV